MPIRCTTLMRPNPSTLFRPPAERKRLPFDPAGAFREEKQHDMTFLFTTPRPLKTTNLRHPSRPHATLKHKDLRP